MPSESSLGAVRATTRPCPAERALAASALELALPSIRTAIADKDVCGAGFLHIVVLSPSCGPHDGDFDDAILLEHSEGDPARWDADYRAFALAKARLSWRTGLGTHELQTLRPHLLRTGDTALWGSAVVDGIVVAVSGAQPWYDEAFSGFVALAYRALAKRRAAERAPSTLVVA